jgi:hypothetical protein
VERQLEDLACNFVVDKSIEAMFGQLWPDYQNKLSIGEILGGCASSGSQANPGVFSIIDAASSYNNYDAERKLMEKLSNKSGIEDFLTFTQDGQFYIRHTLSTDGVC